MKKYIRKHLKDEKRILKLMYKKGIFKTLGTDLKQLGWEYLVKGKRSRKRKGKRKYSFSEYLPELHEFTQDYWGESDSHGVISSFKYNLWHESAKNFDDNGYPTDGKYFKNPELIKYLQGLPTKNNDNNFNIILKRNDEQ